MSFSTRRIAAGFTLDDISREFRVSPAAVRDWEEGKAQPPLHIARSLDLMLSFAVENIGDLKPAPTAGPDKTLRSRPVPPAAPPPNGQVPANFESTRMRLADDPRLPFADRNVLVLPMIAGPTRGGCGFSFEGASARLPRLRAGQGRIGRSTIH